MKKMNFALLILLALGISAGGFVYRKEIKTALFNAHPLIPPGESPDLANNHESAEKPLKFKRDQLEKMGIEIRSAEAGALFMTLSTRGKISIDPNRLAHIIPKVPGIATETCKNIGNDVQLNEVIAILESQEMADLKAEFLVALNKEKLAFSVLQREEKLYQKRISSEQDYFNAQNAYADAQINVQLSRQKLRAFGLDEENIQHLGGHEDPDLRLYEIRSPMDGTVIMRHITKGEFIDKSAKIYEIADLSTLWVEIGIYPKDLHQIRKDK